MLNMFRRRDRSLGQSLTEFALILPVLILALLIVIDFGRLYFSYVTLTNATRVAANFGAVDPGDFTGTPNTATYNSVVSRETAGINCTIRAVGGLNPPIPTFPGGSALGGYSVATMTCDFKLLTPIIGSLFGGNLPITASAQFPVRTGAIENISGSTTLPPPGSPVAGFTFTGVSGGTVNGSGNVTGTAPVTVNVVDGSANAQTWEWDWGDGTAHEFSPTPLPHQYNGANTTYTVTLRVTNTVGSSTTTRTVALGSVVVPPPLAGFYGTPVSISGSYVAGGGSGGTAISGTMPLRIDFTNTSTNGGTAFSWNFGDGTPVSTAIAPQHQYSSLGIFTVTLSVTTPAGGTPSTRSSYVTVGCVVPNFAATLTSAANSTWSGANFSGQVSYHKVGDPANKSSKSPPSPTGTIKSQSIQGGIFITPTQTGNQPFKCGDDITVDYQ